jgi:thioredoxin-related protein
VHSVGRLCAYALCLICAAQTWALDAIPFARNSFLDLKQDALQAQQANRTLMLMLEQEGCVYCIEMRRVNFSDREIAEYVASNFDLVQLDIWGNRDLVDFTGETMSEKTYARKRNIQLTPMTLFFDAQGKELFRMTGYYKPALYKAALRYVAERQYEKIRFRDFAKDVAVDEGAGGLRSERFILETADLSAAMRNAAQHGKGLALLFAQERCQSCVELYDKTFGDENDVRMLTGAYEVVRLNVWGKRPLKGFDGAAVTEARLAESMDIRYTPTVVFFDTRGQEIFRYDSYRKPEHFRLLLRYLTTDARTRYASFQDWLRVEHP